MDTQRVFDCLDKYFNTTFHSIYIGCSCCRANHHGFFLFSLDSSWPFLSIQQLAYQMRLVVGWCAAFSRFTNSWVAEVLPRPSLCVCWSRTRKCFALLLVLFQIGFGKNGSPEETSRTQTRSENRTSNLPDQCADQYCTTNWSSDFIH